MIERVLYEDMVHLVERIMMGIDWRRGPSTQELFVVLLCTGLYHPEKSAVFVHDDVDCMSCLVTQAREGNPDVRIR